MKQDLKNQTITHALFNCLFCSGWKQSYVLEIFEAMLMTTVDENEEKNT